LALTSERLVAAERDASNAHQALDALEQRRRKVRRTGSTSSKRNGVTPGVSDLASAKAADHMVGVVPSADAPAV